jgi:succinyl-CoA synthetase beta subunit
LNVHEYQAKALLARAGVAVPRGEVVEQAADASRVARALGETVVVKAQIHAGGRGRGTFRTAAGEPVKRPGRDTPLGGVVVAPASQVEEIVARMLGASLVTKQTGPEGRTVRRVLIAEALDIAREFYVALLLDRTVKSPSFVASAEGGMEIEEVAASRPEAILRLAVDPAAGYSPWMGRKIALGLGLAGRQLLDAARLIEGLHQAYVATDASLVEVNPLITTADGRVIALDAKMSFDDNALWRRPEIRELRDTTEEDPLEVEASRHGLNYIKLEGSVGCMVNGAGLAMSTMDIIKLHGGSPANFLDVGGGATTEMVTQAFRILLADPHVRAVLINIFGGIMRCDIVAEGVVAAAREVGVRVPVVVRLEGTNVERGQQILVGSGLDFKVANGMDQAARMAVAAAREA